MHVIQRQDPNNTVFDGRFWGKDLTSRILKPQDLDDIRSQIIRLPAVLVLSVNDIRHFFGKVRIPASRKTGSVNAPPLWARTRTRRVVVLRASDGRYFGLLRLLRLIPGVVRLPG